MTKPAIEVIDREGEQETLADFVYKQTPEDQHPARRNSCLCSGTCWGYPQCFAETKLYLTTSGPKVSSETTNMYSLAKGPNMVEPFVA